MPTARYWRLNTPGTPGGITVTMREVAFLDSASVDLSVGGTAFASSEFSGAFTADLAFDKNTATAWANAAGAFPAYIGYDHGVAVTVDLVRFRGVVPQEYPVSLASMSVQWSSDNVTWSTPLRLRYESGTIDPGTDVVAAFWDGVPNTMSVGDEEFFVTAPVPTELSVAPLVGALKSFRDFEFGGFGRIAGTVKEDGTPDVPVKRRVRLHREQDGLVVREVWSHPTTGAYSFDYIDATKRYTVITYDYEHDYRAVIADNITPEAMP